MSFCNNITPDCGLPYSTSLSDCNDLTLATGLVDGDYYFTIIDKFGQGWTNQYTVTGGNVTLNVTNYSDGFFNPYAGKYEIFAHTIINVFTKLTLTIGGSSYTSILFTMTTTCCSDGNVSPTPIEDFVTIQINGSSFDTADCQTVYNVIVKNTNGDAVGSKVGTEWIVPALVQDLQLKFYFQSGNDVSATETIDADSAGTLTAISDDGGSGTITISINGGAFGAFSNPTTLVATDTIQVKRTTTTSAGWVKITGTY